MDFPKLALSSFISEYGCVFPVQSCSLFLVLPILISLFIHDCCWRQLWSYCRLLWLLTIDWWSNKSFPVIGIVIVPIVRLVGYLTTTFRMVYTIAHNEINSRCLLYLLLSFFLSFFLQVQVNVRFQLQIYSVVEGGGESRRENKAWCLLLLLLLLSLSSSVMSVVSGKWNGILVNQ